MSSRSSHARKRQQGVWKPQTRPAAQSALPGWIRPGHRTWLGIGPVTKNTVDAAIELAQDCDVPLCLVASRRQIECAELGGGYVNGWTTESFAAYVRERDVGEKIVLARDHAGPWQGRREALEKWALPRAMESAKASLEADIVAGFELLHLDPSVGQDGSEPALHEILDRSFELYEHCARAARFAGTEVGFEVGMEEQTTGFHDPAVLEKTLSEISRFCAEAEVPSPRFVVVQLGTKVMESRNVGCFESPPSDLAARIESLSRICAAHGVWIKEHNTDYLGTPALERHLELGIHAANVAPEFAVCETRALVALLEASNLLRERDRFLELAFDSGQWKKWMLPRTQATDLDRAVIAGHYVYSKPEFAPIRRAAEKTLAKRGLELDALLREEVKAAIARYVQAFALGAQSGSQWSKRHGKKAA